MALVLDKIIWITDKTGVTLEQNDKGNYVMVAVKKYESQGAEKVAYDYAFGQQWDKATRKWVPSDKAYPKSLYLGEESKAIEALSAMLDSLGQRKLGTEKFIGALDDDDGPPF